MSKKLVFFIISILVMGSLLAIGGDDFNLAVPITALPYNDTGDTTNLTNVIGYDSNDAFYVINAVTQLTNVSIDLTGSSFDTYLTVYDSNHTELWSDDDSGVDSTSLLSGLTLDPYVDYFICVEGYSTYNGSYVMNVIADQAGTINDADAPAQISNILPVNGAVNVDTIPTLSWDFGANTETYDVYLDTVYPPVTQVVSGDVAGANGSYTPTSDLALGTWYYWKVVGHNTLTTTTSIANLTFQTTLGDDVLTIGSGTETNTHLPIEPYYGYSYTQTIYLQSEIDVQGRRIEKVAYHYNMDNTLNNCNEWVIYMGHTSNTSYNGNDSWLPIDQFQVVYTGPLPTIPADGWIEFNLTAPFVYNNIDNLVIAVEENQQDFGLTTEEFYGTTVTDQRSIFYYNDTTDTDPVSPLTANGTSSIIPNTRLTFGDVNPNGELAVYPDSIDFGIVFVEASSDPVTITMQNIGGSSLNVSSVVLNDTSNFSLVDNNTYPLTLDSTILSTFEVIFNPVVDGPISSTITITDDVTRISHDVTITGTGFEATVSSYPYSQTFDTDEYPIEWTVNPVDDSWVLANNEFGGHGAPNEATGNNGYYIGVDDSDPDTIPAHLYSPPFNLSGLTNPILAFNYWIGDAANTSTINIDVSVGGNTTSDLAVISDPDGATEWAYYEVSLADYINQTVIIDFRAMETAGDFYGDICVDDIALYDNSAPPAPTTLISPTDTETGVAMTGDLVWNTTQGTSGYYVSLGTDNPPTDVYNTEDVGNTTSLSYAGLQAGVTYYWQVIPYNPNGNASNCPIWSFTTFNELPLATTAIAPANLAESVPELPTLSWNPADNFPDGYKLYLGSDNPPTDINNGLDLGLVTSYEVTTPLQFETTYYWQIVPYNFVGDAINCPIWSFTTNSNQNYGGDGTLYGGYYFANSTDAGNGLGHQPLFEWVEISDNETTLNGANITTGSYDDGYWTVPIGFTFNFFGNDYTELSICSNGTIQFSNYNSNHVAHTNLAIPNSEAPNDLIAFLAMDSDPEDIPSTLTYGNDEEGNFVYTALMYDDYNDPAEYIDVQVILYQSGRIKIQYRNYVNPNGDIDLNSIIGDTCVGIENADGTIGHQYRNNGVGGPINDPMAICYAQTPGDLSDGGNGLMIPTDIEFNVVTVNDDSDVFQLRMRNFTDTTIVIANQPTLTGDDIDQFEITDNNTYPLSIAQGTQATMDIVFSPTSVGHKTGMLTIVDDFVPEEEVRNTYEISLHGYGFVQDTNDSSTQAIEFALYDDLVEEYEAIIQPETDVDWYVFWQTAPAELDIHTENANGSTIDLAAFLYGPYDEANMDIDEFSAVDFDDDSWNDNMNPHIVYNVPDDTEASGFYYLRIARSDNSPEEEEVRVSKNDSFAGSNKNTLTSSINKAKAKDNQILEQHPEPTEPTTRWSTGDYKLWISTDNPVRPSGFDEPINLAYTITYQGVNLTWGAPIPATRQLEGYNVYRDDSIINTDPVTSLFYLDTTPVIDETYEYKITAIYSAPAGESVASDSVMVTFIGVDPPIIAEDFESYDDFATSMQYWTLLDVDGEDTFGFTNGISFPGDTDPMSFIIFNPSSTTPPLQFADAFSGDKYGACFSAESGPNDDWLITPKIQLTNETAYLNFKVRSYTTQFGPELIEVAISNGGNEPEDFTVISGDSPIEASQEWSLHHIELDNYATQLIRVAFHCISDETFFLMIDDIEVMNNGATLDSHGQVAIPDRTALCGNYPNPFNPETTINFDLKENSPVTIDVYNIKGQRIATVADGDFNAGHHSVVWNGIDNNGKQVSSGVYFYKMHSGTYTKSRKMILIK